MSLSPNDKNHVQAAKGWLRLGDVTKANAEINKVSRGHRVHATVLFLHYRICLTKINGRLLFFIANIFTKLAPDTPFWWLQRSNALQRLGKTERAWHALLTVGRKFRSEYTVSYALARYAASVGETDQARAFLANAFHSARMSEGIQVAEQVRLSALNDPSLKDLWPWGLEGKNYA